MAKEITHMLVAQDVLRRLEDTGHTGFARVIGEHMGVFLSGAIIPDALFYDVPPFRMNPLKHQWIARRLHGEQVAASDDRAMRFFRFLALDPSEWQLKLSFISGIVTHTVVDRIFHETIDHYLETWGETGTRALATHREIETLVDLLLLKGLSMTPRDFLKRYLKAHAGSITPGLCRLYIRGVMEGDGHLDPMLPHVLRRAHRLQRAFLNAFAMRSCRTALKIMNTFTGGRLQAWDNLFYENPLSVQNCPVLVRLGSSSASHTEPFFKEVVQLRKAALKEAVRNLARGILIYG